MTEQQTQEEPRQTFPQPAVAVAPGPGVLNRTPTEPPPDQPVAPSSVATVDHMAQVMVDQWGHRGEYIRGDILDRGALNPSHYDWDHAVRMGVLRPLTQAEARSFPTTTALDSGGLVDQDHVRAMRYQAGITADLPRTVTTEQGPAEPAEFAKPTIPFTGDNQPAARPIVVASALEAETEGTRAARTVATSSGPVYESATDRQARESGGAGGRPSASELTARARTATTTQELDAIDAQADNRMTSVHDAVAVRRAELQQQG